MGGFRIWADAPKDPCPCPKCGQPRQLYQEGPGRPWECLECTFGPEAYADYCEAMNRVIAELNEKRRAAGWTVLLEPLTP